MAKTDTPRAGTARPSVKGICILAAGLIGTIATGLCLALYLYLGSGAFQTRLAALVNARIPGTLSWKRLDLSLVRGRLGAQDLVLTDPAGSPVARIPALEIKMDWTDLWTGELQVSSVKVTRPHLILTLSDQGRDSLTAALVTQSGDQSGDQPQTGPTVLPLAVHLQELLVQDGKLELLLPHTRLNLYPWNLNLAGRLDQDYQTISNQISSNPKDPDTAGLNRTGLNLTGLNLTGQIPGIRLTASGSIRNLLQTPVPDISAALSAETQTVSGLLAPLLKQASGKKTAGEATLTVHLKGALDNPGADLSLVLGPGTMLGQSLTGARISARLENRRIILAPSTLDPGPGPFMLEGSLDLSSMFPRGFTQPPAGPETLAYTLDLSHKGLPADWLASRITISQEKIPSMSGTLAPTLTLTGQGIDPGNMTAEIHLELAARQITLPRMIRPADLSIAASARLDSLDLNLNTITLKGPGIFGQGKASMDLSQNSPDNALSARISLTAPDLSVPAGLLGTPAAGSARLNLSVEGSLDHPILTADLEADDLSLFHVNAGRFTAAARMDRDHLVLQQAVLTQNSQTDNPADSQTNNPPGQLRARGQIPLTAPADLNADLNAGLFLANLDIDNLDLAALNLKNLVPGHPIHGRVSGQITANGSPDQPGVRAHLTGEALSVGEIFLGRLDTDLRLSKSILSVDRATLVRNDTRVTAEGRINFEENTLNLKTRAPDLNLATLPELTGLNFGPDSGLNTGLYSGRAALELDIDGPLSAPRLRGRIRAQDLQTDALPQITGDLSADFQAQGPFDNPETMGARAVIKQALLSRDSRPLLEMDSAELSLEKGRLQLSPVPLRLLGQSGLTLAGRLDSDGNLEASARGSLPLALVPDLAEGIQSAKGEIHLDLSAQGPVRSPDIRGDLSFSDLTLALEDLASPFERIRGKIRFSPDQVDIQQLEGRLGDGEFKVQGRADLNGGRPDRLAVNLDTFQLPIEIPETLSLLVNSRLALTGTPEKSELAGTVDLLDGRYYKHHELNLKDLAPRKTRQITPVAAGVGPDFLKTMVVNIQVRPKAPLLVDNNLALLTVRPDLTIRGTALNPILAGQARVEEGSLFFYKTRFDVIDGTLAFTNPYRMAPEIDLTAETLIRSWTITVKAAGSPDDLRLSFASDPSESDADILSLITLGKTTREMASARGRAQTSGAGAAAGLIAGPLGETLKAATGLDEVDIRMDNEGDATGVKISLGADLSRQLSVAYGMDIKDGETVQQVTTYYKLLEHLLLSGFQDTSGRFGGGLKYRLEFR